jgi:Protein of unknown function (DUF1822)
MMVYLQKPMVTTILLSNTVRQIADKFCQSQSSLQKADQVYLNTLAVYAMHEHLRQLGFATDLNASDSWNPVMQTLMNVADLQICHYGKLECRPVRVGEETVYIPPEVWGDRLAYVVVQINESLDEATLLGFIENKVENKVEELSLDKLRSIADLPDYLHQNQSDQTTQISQWLQGNFEVVWQVVEEVLSPQHLTIAWRGQRDPLSSQTLQHAIFEINRVKVLNFGLPPEAEQVALLVRVIATEASELNIGVQICPTGDRLYLPSQVQVRLLNALGAEITQARATVTETILLQFSGKPGEQFSIEVTSGARSLTETFMI